MKLREGVGFVWFRWLTVSWYRVILFGGVLACFWISSTGMAERPASAAPKIPLRVYITRNLSKSIGPYLKATFEKAYPLCEVIYCTGVSPAQMVSSLGRLDEGRRPDILVQVAYDFFQGLPPSQKETLFATLERIPGSLTIPWKDQRTLPISRTLLGVVYHEHALKAQDLPTCLEDLLKLPDRSLVMIDPRTSQTGLSFLLWVKQVYGDQARDFWKRLKPKILTITKEWSHAYALFLKGEAPAVLSYTLSPVCHRIMENRQDIKVAVFEAGHYPTVYTAAVFKWTKQPYFAQKFLQLLLSQPVQEKIVREGWAYPVVALDQPLPPGFEDTLKVLPYIPGSQIRYSKSDWIAEWLDALSG